jgi:L-asparagine transporter-like permease
MNFVVLTAALSGANAALYVASRMLFSLARSGWAPASLGRLNSAGSPRAAVLASSYGIIAALVLENWAPRTAFVSILGAVLVGMLLSWLVSLAAHVSFRWQLSPAQLASLPMRSPFRAWGSMVGFVLVIVAILEQGSRLALVSGAVFMVLLTGAYFLLKDTRRKRTISV